MLENINLMHASIIGLIVILFSFILMLYKKKYDIAIGLFFVVIAYSIIMFIFKGVLT